MHIRLRSLQNNVILLVLLKRNISRVKPREYKRVANWTRAHVNVLSALQTGWWVLASYQAGIHTNEYTRQRPNSQRFIRLYSRPFGRRYYTTKISFEEQIFLRIYVVVVFVIQNDVLTDTELLRWDVFPLSRRRSFRLYYYYYYYYY